jgi:SAM-dependent methyltransferase
MNDAERAWMQQSRTTWDERAPWWNEIAEVYAAAPDRQADLARVAAALGLQPGAALLDAGCGAGQFAVAFARMKLVVTAVDLSPAMVAFGRQHAQEAGVSVAWQDADISVLSDADGSFDAVHARLSLHFAPDIPAALRELRRVLKPEGRLYASLPGALSPIYGNAWQRHLDPNRRANNYATPWELEALLGHAGWEVIEQWADFGPTPDGELNPLFSESLSSLPIRLQQAAATTWAIVAAPPNRAESPSGIEAIGGKSKT